MKKYLFPALISIGIILVGSLITSILYYFNITSDKINDILIYLIAITSLFTGSFCLGKNLKYKGIVSGIIYFIVFFITSIIISLLIFDFSFKASSLIFYLVLLIFSALGGIIGKNSQKENDVI